VMVKVTSYGALPEGPEKRGRSRVAFFSGVAALSALVAVGIVALAASQDWDNGSVTLAQLNQQEARDRAHMQSLAGIVRGGQITEDTAANPEGAILENVPATVIAPVPGPPDFNGASAVIARLPNIGFAPSMLTEKGFETRGSFTVRKSRAGESFYLRVYGKLNHNMRCTLRGYRNLMGDFTGNTIYTGFKKIYTGKSQLHTQHIPRGITGEFDIMTCRDLGNGEVQYFRIRYD